MVCGMENTARAALARQLDAMIPARPAVTGTCPDCGSTGASPCRSWRTGAALPYPHTARTAPTTLETTP